MVETSPQHTQDEAAKADASPAPVAGQSEGTSSGEASAARSGTERQRLDAGEFLAIANPVRRRVIVAFVFAFALLAASLGLGWQAGVITPRPVPLSDGMTALTTRGFLDVMVRADSWEHDHSSPVIAYVQRSDAEEGFYHAMDANVHEILEVESGEYLVSFIAPVNEDGSYYHCPEPEEVRIERGHTGVTNVQLEYVPATEGRWVEYQEIIDRVGAALEFGDTTLQEGRGEEILEWVANNANASPFYARQ